MANRYIPFGYEIVDAKFVIIEREAEVVKMCSASMCRDIHLKL